LANFKCHKNLLAACRNDTIMPAHGNGDQAGPNKDRNEKFARGYFVTCQ
jgi:hypothetical protein